ncbi:MAG: transporter substrate-binding domain-containing protein [Candidatus Saccharibacteria bacterium]|nr:transporter substrate-binding domain-containing protein [Candidatus Saccharibacteria bacterium]
MKVLEERPWRERRRGGDKKARKKFPKLLVFGVGFIILSIVSFTALILNIEPVDYVVETNAFFAPFEFYRGREIIGVDVEIIERVAERMGKKIKIQDVEFDVIIDNVEAGRIADAGAAGLTITPAREEKVNFTIPYYTSTQYVIYDKTRDVALLEGHIVWEELRGKVLGTQIGSTGYLFTAEEIDNGVLKDTGTVLKGFDSHQIAADAIGAHIVDFSIADQLAAEFIVKNNSNLTAVPLYYKGDYSGETVLEDRPVEESYAIAVNKERTELLDAFNGVLIDMTEKDPKGISEIDRLVIKYMGIMEEESNE